MATPQRYRPVSNLTESVCLVATLPVQDWVICALAAFLPCGTPWVGVHLWQTRCMPVTTGHKGTRVPTGYPGGLGTPSSLSSTLHSWTERFFSLTERSGLSVLVSNRGPGLPCTAPVADDSVADKTGFDPRHRVSSVIFESFLARFLANLGVALAVVSTRQLR